MPRPIYIICAENITVDRDTNLVSIFNVLEKIEVSGIIQHADPKHRRVSRIHGGSSKAVAVWARVQGDEGKKFEAQFEVSFPDGKAESSPILPFVFEGPMLLHRFIMSLQMHPIQQSGKIRVENRVRRQGTDTWQSQAYEIFVESSVHDLTRKPDRPARVGKKKRR